MDRSSLFLLSSVMIAFWSFAAHGQPPEPNSSDQVARRDAQKGLRERLLNENHVNLTAEGLDAFFQSHSQRPALVRKIVPQLGANRFAKRNDATRLLTELPTVPRELLSKLSSESTDAEIRHRIDRVLAETSHKPNHGPFPRRSVCHAILNGLIAKSKTGGKIDAAVHLEEIVSRYSDLEMLSLTADAVTVVERNEDTVARWIRPDKKKLEPNLLQLIALPTVAKNDPANWLEKMKKWSNNLDQSGEAERAFFVRLQRLNLGDEQVVDEWVEGLNASKEEQRNDARRYVYQALKLACNHPDRPLDPNAWNGWRDWLTKQSRPLTLHLPVEIEFASFERFLQRIKVVSTSFSKGNTAAIEWNGQLMLGNGGIVDDRRGLNVLAVYRGEPLIIGSYDSFTTVEAVNAFAEDIRQLPEGTFVAVVACDEPSRYWNAAAQKAIESIGAMRSERGTLTGKYRHAYYCLGEKGAKPGTAREAIDPAGGPLAYPKAYAREAKIVDEGPDEYRKESRVRIIRGVSKKVKW